MAMPYFFYETELKEMFVYMNFNHIYTLYYHLCKNSFFLRIKNPNFVSMKYFVLIKTSCL